MSENHSGNSVPEITREEHDGILYAKRASLVSAATIYAVVNTGSTGNVTLDPGSQTRIVGNVTLSDSKTFIGLTTTTLGASPALVGIVTVANRDRSITGNLTLSDSKGFIGLTTVTGSDIDVRSLNSTATLYAVVNTGGFSGNVTLDDGSLTGIIGNVTLSDAKTYIGLVSVSGFTNPLPVTFSGNVTLDDGSLTGIIGNVTLSDAKTYIGLTTTTIGNALITTSVIGNVTLSDAKTFVGLVSVSGFVNPLPVTFSGNITLDDGSLTGVVGNVTLSDAKTYIGLTTTTVGNALVTTSVIGNVTLSDAKTFIGLTTTTLGASPAFVGIVTVANRDRTITGNLTLSDAKTYIGLVTTTYAPPPISSYTSFATIYSATGNATLFVPPANKRWVAKDIHIGSLGKSEVAIKSGTGYIVPFTSLATQGGYFEHYGEAGLAADAADLAFVIELNGGATISVMTNVRFE